MDSESWDVFLEQYQKLQEKLDTYEQATWYAISAFGKQGQDGYLEEIQEIIKDYVELDDED